MNRCAGKQERFAFRPYTESMPESRIVADHRIMDGVPCIRGTRIPVATVVGRLAQGLSVTEILADYPQLSADDVRASLEFAAAAVSEGQVPLRTTAQGSCSTSASVLGLHRSLPKPGTTSSTSLTAVLRGTSMRKCLPQHGTKSESLSRPIPTSASFSPSKV